MPSLRSIRTAKMERKQAAIAAEKARLRDEWEAIKAGMESNREAMQAEFEAMSPERQEEARAAITEAFGIERENLASWLLGKDS